MTILLALMSGLMWGAADFFGGSASRRLPALLVVLVSQAAGLVLVLLIAASVGAFSARTGYLPWAVAAGLVGAFALLLYYRALAIGTMGVVAPIASLGVVVPVAIGLFTGTLPTALCLVGIVVAISGVVATAGPGTPDSGQIKKPGHARSVLLAVGSATGFGVVLFAISEGAKYSAVMTMVTMRCSSVPALLVVAVVAFRPRSEARAQLGQRRPLADWRLVAVIITCGVFDVGANLLFGVASGRGSLAVVAVLGSLYPAGTVLLARFVDGERMTSVQNVGVVAALAGVAMIAVGS